jgi:hypothetical protein
MAKFQMHKKIVKYYKIVILEIVHPPFFITEGVVLKEKFLFF